MRRGALAAIALALGLAPACNGTTGDQLLSFAAYASGAKGAGDPFVAGGYTIQLTAAKMHLGAIYFNEAQPGATGFDGPVCIGTGVYAAQVPGPVDVDLLSTSPQEFSVYGYGSTDTVLSWQAWLTDGDVNEVNFTPIVRLEGTATDAQGATVSFGALVTINAANRSKGSSDPSQPGLDPLCRSRIVQMPTDFTFAPGGALYVTVDPRVWFQEQSTPIAFGPGQLPSIDDPDCNPDSAVPTTPASFALVPDAPPPTVCIPNSSFLSGTVPGATAGADLFAEVTSGAAFSVSYVVPPP